MPEHHFSSERSDDEVDEPRRALRIESEQHVAQIRGRILCNPPRVDVPIISAGVRHTRIAVAPRLRRRFVNRSRPRIDRASIIFIRVTHIDQHIRGPRRTLPRSSAANHQHGIANFYFRVNPARATLAAE